MWCDECRDILKIEEAKVQTIGTGLSRGEAMDQVKAVRNAVTVKAPGNIAGKIASQVYLIKKR